MLEKRLSREMRLLWRSLNLLLPAFLLPAISFAHVKWFCSYDVSKPTKPISEVVAGPFLYILPAFTLLLLFAFLADGWVAKKWPNLESWNAVSPRGQEKIVRVGMQAFFLCTWTIGLNIITPELHTQSTWIFGVQFVTAIALFWRRSCFVSALGIGVLWLAGVWSYGLFHMLDYVYFLGAAFYLAATSFSGKRLLEWRAPVITGGLAFSLIWTAIEKLLYPQWTAQVMIKHGHMMMGMKFEIFIVVAAFVEFTLAFYLATGRGLLRLGALALLVVFVSAMPEFGTLDVVGHFPVVAILSVPFLAGDSSLQRFWRLPQFGIIVNAFATCALFVSALAVFLFLYHGVQWLEYH
jgi:hypothetical protein